MDLHVLIVDDDVTSRTLLARLVDKHHRLRLVDSCADPIEALHAMQEHQVDVIFLDVEMPQMSGLDLVRSLDHPPKIVLVSGNAGYAAEAFELDVVDYLVKPVTLPRFTKAVSRLMREAQAPGRPMRQCSSEWMAGSSGSASTKYAGSKPGATMRSSRRRIVRCSRTRH